MKKVIISGIVVLILVILYKTTSGKPKHDDWHNFDGSVIVCRVVDCGRQPLYSDWDNRFCAAHIDRSANYQNAQKQAEDSSTDTGPYEIPYIGMSESKIQNTELGIAALTYESGGVWGGEVHTIHHYTWYYRYDTHTDVVFSCEVENGYVDEINDHRSSPIRVSKGRHDTMLAAGVPVNYK